MKKLEFKVGDHVFYPGAGVGRIDAEEDLYVSDRWERCFIIRICDNPLTIKIPHGSVAQSGMRPLLACNKLQDLFRVLGGKTGERTGSNWTEHYKDLERKINNGSSLQLGEVVRDLMRLRKRHGLSFEEARLLETSCGHLANELAMVEGIPSQIAAEQIRKQVGLEAS